MRDYDERNPSLSSTRQLTPIVVKELLSQIEYDYLRTRGDLENGLHGWLKNRYGSVDTTLLGRIVDVCLEARPGKNSTLFETRIVPCLRRCVIYDVLLLECSLFPHLITFPLTS